jgi:hypothetical protein
METVQSAGVLRVRLAERLEGQRLAGLHTDEPIEEQSLARRRAGVLRAVGHEGFLLGREDRIAAGRCKPR